MAMERAMNGRPARSGIGGALGAIAIFILVGIGAAPAFGQAGRAGSLAIMPYHAPPGSLPPQYAFTLYAVVDVIRLTLLEEDRFALVERAELDAAARSAGLADGWAEDEGLCLNLARGLNADYMIRGYVAWTGERLKVTHLLVDARSGRTLHVGERSLGTGPDLVRDIEESAKAFSVRVARALPDREPDTVIVEKETLVVRDPPRRVVEAGASVAFPMWRIAEYLAPSAGLRLGYRTELGSGSSVSLGASAELYLLNQRQSFFSESGQSIDVLFVPVFVEGRWTAARSGFLALELSAAAGPAVVFGLVSPAIISYFRPAAALGAELVLFPSSRVSIAVGGAASWTFFIYEELQLPSLQPRLLVRLGR